MHQQHVIPLLIHGYLPVNARLLIAFGTAFYAIMLDVIHVIYIIDIVQTTSMAFIVYCQFTI